MESASGRVIETNGAALRIAEGGTGEPALVFLHYWGGSARTWQRVLHRVSDQVHWVAINQRGWGGSVATDGRYDLADYSRKFRRRPWDLHLIPAACFG
jgi:pimeloyl-ACP methyl ester carboxylesterase